MKEGKKERRQENIMHAEDTEKLKSHGKKRKAEVQKLKKNIKGERDDQDNFKEIVL